MNTTKGTRRKPLRCAVFGAGFWTRHQLAAWGEVCGVELIAIYNRTKAKAEAVAREFQIPAVYDDADKLLREVKPDFVDNITEVGGHKPLSLLCARHRVPCICPNPQYDVAHASIVDCHRDLLCALRGEGAGETTGTDNLKTLELVFGCYESAAKGRVLHFKR